MNLNTVTAVKRPASTDEIPEWREGCAWLAGGTWLFSTPQIDTHTLIDLESLRWPALKATADGLEIAATCTIAELERFQAPTEWAAAPLLRLCSHALLMSFKIYNAATVGGNICMSLPAGAMISLTTSLEGSYNLWPRKGKPRQVSALDFVTGNHKNVLEPGELLRSIHLPASALTKRFAFRRNSLTHLGRSAALIIGTQTKKGGDLLLTVTAATAKPIQLRFDRLPSAEALRRAIEANVAEADWFDDVHGSAPYKRHLTYYYAEQIRAELAGK
ncbi:MAG TPA: FAD binding domain-containing protein [Hyphomicrobiaceae bacterium]|jgi:CO/xanthine dehydrogenase FAD-binding subunit|nr:FAD binding domain-containing protein [Hyphomicrobiaceae bacterium]